MSSPGVVRERKESPALELPKQHGVGSAWALRRSKVALLRSLAQSFSFLIFEQGCRTPISKQPLLLLVCLFRWACVLSHKPPSPVGRCTLPPRTRPWLRLPTVQFMCLSLPLSLTAGVWPLLLPLAFSLPTSAPQPKRTSSEEADFPAHCVFRGHL